MTSISKSPVPHLQTEWEFDTLIKNFYIPLQPKIVMEIGSFFGATLWSFIQNNPILEKIISVDMLIPPEDGRYMQMVDSRSKWNSWSDKIAKVEDNSRSSFSYGLVQHYLGENMIDFLFIDGDHSYQGVKGDYLLYEKLVRPGGLIVFHDSVGYDSVAKFCKELRNMQGSKVVEISQKDGWGLFVIEK